MGRTGVGFEDSSLAASETETSVTGAESEKDFDGMSRCWWHGPISFDGFETGYGSWLMADEGVLFRDLSTLNNYGWEWRTCLVILFCARTIYLLLKTD